MGRLGERLGLKVRGSKKKKVTKDAVKKDKKEAKPRGRKKKEIAPVETEAKKEEEPKPEESPKTEESPKAEEESPKE
jgi:hypothetical protein